MYACVYRQDRTAVQFHASYAICLVNRRMCYFCAATFVALPSTTDSKNRNHETQVHLKRNDIKFGLINID